MYSKIEIFMKKYQFYSHYKIKRKKKHTDKNIKTFIYKKNTVSKKYKNIV